MHFNLTESTKVLASTSKLFMLIVSQLLPELARVTYWIWWICLPVTELFLESVVVSVELVDYCSFFHWRRMLSITHWNVEWISRPLCTIFLLNMFLLQNLIQAKHIFRRSLSCFLLLWSESNLIHFIVFFVNFRQRNRSQLIVNFWHDIATLKIIWLEFFKVDLSFLNFNAVLKRLVPEVITELAWCCALHPNRHLTPILLKRLQIDMYLEVLVVIIDVFLLILLFD